MITMRALAENTISWRQPPVPPLNISSTHTGLTCREAGSCLWRAALTCFWLKATYTLSRMASWSSTKIGFSRPPLSSSWAITLRRFVSCRVVEAFWWYTFDWSSPIADCTVPEEVQEDPDDHRARPLDSNWWCLLRQEYYAKGDSYKFVFIADG